MKDDCSGCANQIECKEIGRLKSGQRVGYVIYDGDFKKDALELFEILKRMKINKEPVYCGVFGDIMMDSVEMVDAPDYMYVERYQVRLKGILV